MLRRYFICSAMLLLFVGYASAQPRRPRPRTTPDRPRRISVTQPLVEQMVRDNAVDRECVELANGRLGDLFSASAIDLNRDGSPELNLIGTGCACRGMRRCMWWIYRQTADGYEQLLEGVPAEDISPLDTSTNGYRDIRVSMWAGSSDMVAIVYRFDGSRYSDANVAPGRTAAPRSKRQATTGQETFVIVPTGENAPEAIVRVVSTTTVAPGRYRVAVVGGPCRSQSRTRSVYIIETEETVTRGDLFFVVPVDENISARGWALRRATSREAAQYASCKWR